MATRPPRQPPRRPSLPARALQRVRAFLAQPRKRWVKWGMVGVGVPLVLIPILTVYFWVSYGRLIDSKIGGDQQAMPRILGRPFEIRLGRGLTSALLVQRLNDVGYAEREKAARPGEFSMAPGAINIVPRKGQKEKRRKIREEFTMGGCAVV